MTFLLLTTPIFKPTFHFISDSFPVFLYVTPEPDRPGPQRRSHSVEPPETFYQPDFQNFPLRRS